MNKEFKKGQFAAYNNSILFVVEIDLENELMSDTGHHYSKDNCQFLFPAQMPYGAELIMEEMEVSEQGQIFTPVFVVFEINKEYLCLFSNGAIKIVKYARRIDHEKENLKRSLTAKIQELKRQLDEL